jgi:hypothetical protein
LAEAVTWNIFNPRLFCCCVVVVTPGFDNLHVLAGTAIEKLCEAALEDSLTDRGAVVRAARCLLGSVTRVLLLADVVVVKQLLLAKDKVRSAVFQKVLVEDKYEDYSE